MDQMSAAFVESEEENDEQAQRERKRDELLAQKARINSAKRMAELERLAAIEIAKQKAVEAAEADAMARSDAERARMAAAHKRTLQEQQDDFKAWTEGQNTTKQQLIEALQAQRRTADLAVQTNLQLKNELQVQSVRAEIAIQQAALADRQQQSNNQQLTHALQVEGATAVIVGQKAALAAGQPGLDEPAKMGYMRTLLRAIWRSRNAKILAIALVGGAVATMAPIVPVQTYHSPDSIRMEQLTHGAWLPGPDVRGDTPMNRTMRAQVRQMQTDQFREVMRNGYEWHTPMQAWATGTQDLTAVGASRIRHHTIETALRQEAFMKEFDRFRARQNTPIRAYIDESVQMIAEQSIWLAENTMKATLGFLRGVRDSPITETGLAVGASVAAHAAVNYVTGGLLGNTVPASVLAAPLGVGLGVDTVIQGSTRKTVRATRAHLTPDPEPGATTEELEQQIAEVLSRPDFTASQLTATQIEHHRTQYTLQLEEENEMIRALTRVLNDRRTADQSSDWFAYRQATYVWLRAPEWIWTMLGVRTGRTAPVPTTWDELNTHIQASLGMLTLYGDTQVLAVDVGVDSLTSGNPASAAVRLVWGLLSWPNQFTDTKGWPAWVRTSIIAAEILLVLWFVWGRVRTRGSSGSSQLTAREMTIEEMPAASRTLSVAQPTSQSPDAEQLRDTLRTVTGALSTVSSALSTTSAALSTMSEFRQFVLGLDAANVGAKYAAVRSKADEEGRAPTREETTAVVQHIMALEKAQERGEGEEGKETEEEEKQPSPQGRPHLAAPATYLTGAHTLGGGYDPTKRWTVGNM